jgi:hypothetical protein
MKTEEIYLAELQVMTMWQNERYLGVGPNNPCL